MLRWCHWRLLRPRARPTPTERITPVSSDRTAQGDLPGSRMWAAYLDGEIVLQVTGPDAERLVRAADHDRVAYRERLRPTAENGWSLNGPWIDVGG